MSKKTILVLESEWSDDLADSTSVRPFLEGWASQVGLGISYRMYYDHASLGHLLGAFVRSEQIDICYVAGHGEGGRLCGRKHDINMGSLAKATKRRSMASRPKGILFGACDVGTRLENFLAGSSRKIAWVAGYKVSVPWMESTLCDLLFLNYLLEGRCRRSDGELLDDYQRARTARKVAKWVSEDYPMADLCQFVVHER